MRRKTMGRTGNGVRATGTRERRYVGVKALTATDGSVTPIEIFWEDGRRFSVDRVIEVRRAHSLTAGGCGLRYSIRVRGTETHLFYDEYRKAYFVEAKAPAASMTKA
jgi:hypothetical protein